jgi:DNA-binding XRE family transcriptional regulator
MARHTKWEDVKRKVREQNPDWDAPDRVARRAELREQMRAQVAGARLAELRREQGMTQKQLAAATGLSQARISQIEKGQSVSLDVMRSYITGLGGQVEVVARIGPLRLDIA